MEKGREIRQKKVSVSPLHPFQTKQKLFFCKQRDSQTRVGSQRHMKRA